MKEQNIHTELGTKNIGSLLVQYATPAIIAMTATSLYNNIGRIFIGQAMGPLAISGLATTFPFMNLAAALGAMVGVGACTVISVRLGQKDHHTAQLVLGNTMTLNLILGTLFSIVCWIFLDPILYIFGASDATIPYARDYMEVILIGNVISHSYLGLNAVLRAAGHPKTAMYCTITTVAINIALAPIFIWWLDLGIRGAALATIIGELVGLMWQLRIFTNPKELLHIKPKNMWLKANIVQQTLAIGMSPFLMNCCACLVVLLFNRNMRTYGGDLAIGAYGIVNSVTFFFVMTVMGLNQGMQPIVGYNWGARNNDRVWTALRYTAISATAVTTACFLMGEFLPELATRLFTSDPEITRMAAYGFRISVMVFPLVGIQMVLGHFFQSIGHAGKSIFLSLTRQLLFLIPLAMVLPNYWGLTGVWASMPISDAISFVTASVMLFWLIRHLREKNRAAE